MSAADPGLNSLTSEEIRKSLEPQRIPLEIACYSTCNYFNFGSMIRTAHNFLCRKLYAVEMDGKFYKKACMGAKKYEDIDSCTLQEFLKRTEGRNLVVFERRPGLDSVPLYDFVWPSEPIIFFGGEKFGVPDEAIEAAHSVVSIPIDGVLNDFNVGVAAGIAAYDWTSKNKKCY